MSNLHKNFKTPEGIASYVNIIEMSELPNGDMAYNMAIIFSKDNEEVVNIKRAISSAIRDKWGEDKSKHPKNLDICLRDGDDKEDSEGTIYENAVYMNLKTKRKPGIVGPDAKPIFDEDEIYSGMVCRCSVNFYGWKNSGKAGVGVGLNNVMKVRDGDRLDGRKSAESEFAEFAVESESDNDDILD